MKHIFIPIRIVEIFGFIDGFWSTEIIQSANGLDLQIVRIPEINGKIFAEKFP
jgi:hypothetical protein